VKQNIKKIISTRPEGKRYPPIPSPKIQLTKKDKERKTRKSNYKEDGE